MVRQVVSVYATALAAFLLLDALWLGVVAGPFYRDQLGTLMRADPAWLIAALFYAVFMIGLTIFAIYPARSPSHSLMLGALFGFFTYATYDMTNLAVVRDWPALVAVVDIAWGTGLCAVVTLIGFAVRRRLAG